MSGDQKKNDITQTLVAIFMLRQEGRVVLGHRSNTLIHLVGNACTVSDDNLRESCG
jgi:hypothetical protein